MTSVMLAQCWCNAGAMLYQMSYEATQQGAGQFAPNPFQKYIYYILCVDISVIKP